MNTLITQVKYVPQIQLRYNSEFWDSNLIQAALNLFDNDSYVDFDDSLLDCRELFHPLMDLIGELADMSVILNYEDNLYFRAENWDKFQEELNSILEGAKTL